MKKCMRKYDNPQIISSRTDMTTIAAAAVRASSASNDFYLVDSKLIILIFLVFYAYLYNYRESMLSSEI